MTSLQLPARSLFPSVSPCLSNGCVVYKEFKNLKFTRKFVKETSVFKYWIEESPKKVEEAFDLDCAMWKLHKFVRVDDQEAEVSLPPKPSL
jgi:hypothetical protein